MAGSQVWNTVGQEAKGWGNLLMSLSQRKREEDYRANQGALQASNAAAAAKKEQERYDYQKTMNEATASRAKAIHDQNVKDWEAKNLDKVMMEGAVGQIPIQYPEGISYEGANQLFQEQGVIDNPEARKILDGLRKDEQFDAKAVLAQLLAGMRNQTTEKVAVIRANSSGGSKKGGGSTKTEVSSENLDGQLAGYLEDEKKYVNAINKMGFTVPNTPNGNQVKTLTATLTNIRKKIADLKSKIGGKIADEDPNNKSKASDRLGILN